MLTLHLTQVFIFLYYQKPTLFSGMLGRFWDVLGVKMASPLPAGLGAARRRGRPDSGGMENMAQTRKYIGIDIAKKRVSNT